MVSDILDHPVNGHGHMSKMAAMAINSKNL